MNQQDYKDIFHYLNHPEDPYRKEGLDKNEKRGIRQKAHQHKIVSGVLHKVIKVNIILAIHRPWYI